MYFREPVNQAQNVHHIWIQPPNGIQQPKVNLLKVIEVPNWFVVKYAVSEALKGRQSSVDRSQIKVASTWPMRKNRDKDSWRKVVGFPGVSILVAEESSPETEFAIAYHQV